MNLSIQYNKRTLLHKALSSVLMFVIVIQSFGVAPLSVFADEILSNEAEASAPVIEEVIEEDVSTETSGEAVDNFSVSTPVDNSGSVEEGQSTTDPSSESSIESTTEENTTEVTEASSDSATLNNSTCPISYPDEVVTADTAGRSVWGSGPYTDDSNLSRAAVHAGLLTLGQTGTIRRTSVGFIESYTGSFQNGLHSESYSGWCGVTLSLVSGPTNPTNPTDPTIPPTSPANHAPVASLSISNLTAHPGDSVTITGSYTDVDGNLFKATIRDLGVGNKNGDLGVYPPIGNPGEIISGASATFSRTFTIPQDAVGTYWFRTEVVDSNHSPSDPSNPATSDIKWISLEIVAHPTTPGGLQCPASYSDVEVTARLAGGSVWGSGPYTDDSNLSRAAVHAGLLTLGQTGTIRRTSVGFIESYTGSFQNGLHSESYSGWCGVTLSLVSGPTNPTNPPVTPPVVPITHPPVATLFSTSINPRPGDTITLFGLYSDADGNLFKATIRDLGTGNKNGDLGVFPSIGQAGEVISGSNATVTRSFTIPLNASGTYWFRTEVVDTNHDNVNNPTSPATSDIEWFGISINTTPVLPPVTPPVVPITHPPVATLSSSNPNPRPGDTIILTGSYTDADGNLFKATIRDLGVGNKNNDLGVYPAIGAAGEVISGSSATLTRTFTIPANASGTYWFRTEVVDTNHDNVNNPASLATSDIEWLGVAINTTPVTPPVVPITHPPVATLFSTSINPRPGDTITLFGLYSDADGNLFKATIRDLGTGNKNGDLGVFPSIGQAGEVISGSNATVTRSFTIPLNASGTYWFRTEVVDTEHTASNPSSDIKWLAVDIAPAVPAPAITISATPSSVVEGSQVTVVWAVSDATSCTASGLWVGPKALSGTLSFIPPESGSYTLVCTGPGGSSNGSAHVTVTPHGGGGGNNNDPVPSVNLTASPSAVFIGATSTLSWISSDAISCLASGAWSGIKTLSGSQMVGPLNATSTYTLACTSTTGKTGTSTVTIGINPPNNNGGGGSTTTPPVFNLFSANPSSVLSGGTSTLSWNVSNATTCIASNGWSGTKTASGSEVVGPLSATTQFTLACTGNGGTATSSVSVTVTTNNGGGGGSTTTLPVIAISANPTHISLGNTTMITWSTTNATSCTASDAWAGNQVLSGTFTSTPTTTGTSIYTLACTGNGGTATSSVLVTVDPAPTNNGGGGSNSGGGGGGGGGRSGGPCIGNCPKSTSTPAILISLGGAVLGAQTSSICTTGDYITTYMRKSMANNPVEVRKLQYFLKTIESLDVDITGYFDDKTDQAVRVFQSRYAQDILTPWDITLPTGYVYITTKNKINSILCGSHPAYTGVVGGVSQNVLYGDGISVGLISSTSTEGNIGDKNTNLALLFPSFGNTLGKLIKDIWWYPLLILILILLGTALIIRSIIVKDINPRHSKECLINGSTALSVASILNVLNTMSFIFNPGWSLSRGHFDMNWMLLLDAINILAIVIITLFVLLNLYFKNSSQR